MFRSRVISNNVESMVSRWISELIFFRKLKRLIALFLLGVVSKTNLYPGLTGAVILLSVSGAGLGCSITVDFVSSTGTMAFSRVSVVADAVRFLLYKAYPAQIAMPIPPNKRNAINAFLNVKPACICLGYCL